MISVIGSFSGEVDLGESFSLGCALEQSSDSVQWHWLKNGASVDEAFWEKGELTVMSSSETDYGIYQCIASNQVGTDMRTFAVRVIS